MPNQVKQLGLKFRTWGGKRRRAGRKRIGERPRVAHRARPVLKGRFPLHVTMRLARDVCDVRQSVCLKVLKRAFLAVNHGEEFQLVHFSLQGNHMHFLVEAKGERELTRGMQSLNIRMALTLNRLMRRRGKVFADRYHAVILQTLAQTRNALHYVLHNRRHHAPGRYPPAWRDPFASAHAPVAPPRTWLLDEASKPPARAATALSSSPATLA